MHAIEQRFGDTVIVRLSGHLTEGSSHRHGALWTLVDGLAWRGARRIVLNLHDVTSVDALGIGEIAEAYRRARDRGATVTLVGADRRVNRLLSITRLSTLIDICDTEAQALDHAPPDRHALESTAAAWA